LHGAENRTLREIDQKYFGSFETWCWRRKLGRSCKKKKNEKVLHREAEYPTYKKKEGLLDWQHLKYVLPSKTRYEGKIERAGSRGKRR
jgi:hypothetical protein